MPSRPTNAPRRARSPHRVPPPRLPAALAASLALLGAGACGGGAPPADELLWISPARGVAFEPAATFDAAGRLWVAWIAWRPDGDVRLLATAIQDGVAAEPLEVSREPGLAVPALAPLRGGVFCVFETAGGIEGRRLEADRHGALALLSDGDLTGPAAGARSPAVAGVAGEDELEVVWQELADDRYVLRAASWGADGSWTTWSPVRDAAGDVWSPRVAVEPAPEGRRHFAWDEWSGESFDVRYASALGGATDLVLDVADGPSYQGFPALSVDDDGMAWIAYEEASGFGEGGPLRESRALRLAAVQDGRVLHVALDEVGAGLPRVLAARDGLLVTSRALHEAWSSIEGQRTTNFNAWATRVTRFDRAAGPTTVTESRIEGDNEATEVLLEAPDGEVWCVFAADERSVAFAGKHGFDDPIEERWRIGALRLPRPRAWPGGSVRPIRSERAPESLAPPTSGRSAARAASGWLFGDLHRHSHLSRCSGAQDGTLLDVYRYARGPGALDFVAVTDHFQHLTPWAWWRSLRDVERWHAPGSLVTFAAIERNVPGQGHHNLVYRSGADARADEPAWDLGTGARARAMPPPPTAVDGERVVAIPHMLGTAGNPFRWERERAELFGLVEVYQGNRGSYEGHGLPYQAKELSPDGQDLARGIALGRLFGLIAASDHSSSASAYAGVRADELTREAVFAALLARETLAATDLATVETRLGELGAGAHGPVAAEAELELEVPGGLPLAADGEQAPLAYVEVVKNGALWRRVDGAGERGPEELAAAGPPAAGTRELYVLTSRHRRAREGRPLEVTVAGGRFTGAARRLRGETGVHAERAGPERVVVTLHGGTADVVLAVERGEARHDGDDGDDADEAGGAAPPLDFTLRFANQETTVSGDAVPPGRSLRFDGLEPQLEYLWRIGPPLGAAGPARFAFADPDRAAGDSYYARVVWENGTVVWTSPIRVERVLAE